MMLRSFTIRNFKCYGKGGATFDLSRVTFIYGNNSVGKSSFLDAVDLVAMAHKDDQGILLKGRPDAFNNGPIDDEDLWTDVCVDASGREARWELRKVDGKWAHVLDRVDHGAVGVLSVPGWMSEVHRVKAGVPSDEGKTTFESLLSALSRDQVNEINEMFRALDVGYECEVNDTLKDLCFGISNLPKDKVGTGIRGIYRYLKAIAGWKRGLLLLEEPEANVNESQLQALARLLVQVAQKRAAVDPDAQLVVECHSEHILLELLGMVADGRLTPEDLSVVYVEKTPDGSVATTCRVDDHGALDKWPDANGFFTARKHILFGEDADDI